MRKRILKTQAQKDKFIKDLQEMVDNMAREFEREFIEESKKKETTRKEQENELK